MNEEIATTPFGGACVDVRQILRRRQVFKEQAERKANGSQSAGPACDKWRILRELTEAKAVYELSDRAIAVLEALLSFHPERQLDGSKPLIVFPSNQQLSLRTRGMSPRRSAGILQLSSPRVSFSGATVRTANAIAAAIRSGRPKTCSASILRRWSWRRNPFRERPKPFARRRGHGKTCAPK